MEAGWIYWTFVPRKAKQEPSTGLDREAGRNADFVAWTSLPFCVLLTEIKTSLTH